MPYRKITYSKHRKATLEVKPRQTDKLNDPRYGLQNLLELIFHDSASIHLVQKAEKILLYIRAKGSLHASHWKEFLQENPTMTYSNYQSALQKLRSSGLLRRQHNWKIQLGV